MPVGFHVGFRRWDAATGTYGGTVWVTPSSPNLPPQGQRWVHTSFFATQTWLSNYTQGKPGSSPRPPDRFMLDPGEALVFTPHLTTDYVKTNGNGDGFAAYPGFDPTYAIVNYGQTIGTYDRIFPQVTPVGSWSWTGGANDLVVIQPYYSDHTSNSAWANSETAVDFWTDNGWPVQEYRGAYITSFKSAVEGPTGQNTLRINYNPAKFRSVTLAAATGTKVPFLSMSLYLKSERGTSQAGRQYPNLAFLHSSLLNRNQTLDGNQKDLLWLRNVGIEFSIDQLFGSWDSDAFQLDPNNRGFVGSGLTAEFGSRYWAGSEQPYWPMIALGLLQNAQVGNQGLGAWRTMGTWISGGAIDFAFGNSAGYPGIPVDAVINQGGDSTASWPTSPSATGTRFLIDHAYLANWSGWDYYFASSLTRQDTAGFAAHGVTRRDFAQVLDEFMRGAARLPNRRLTWVRNSGETDDAAAWARLMTASVPHVPGGIPAGTTRQGDLARTDAHGVLARNLLLEGAFNVNSVSQEAWRAVLLGHRPHALSPLLHAPRALRGQGEHRGVLLDGLPGADRRAGGRPRRGDRARGQAARPLPVPGRVRQPPGRPPRRGPRGLVRQAVGPRDRDDGRHPARDPRGAPGRHRPDGHQRAVHGGGQDLHDGGDDGVRPLAAGHDEPVPRRRRPRQLPRGRHGQGRQGLRGQRFPDAGRRAQRDRRLPDVPRRHLHPPLPGRVAQGRHPRGLRDRRPAAAGIPAASRHPRGQPQRGGRARDELGPAQGSRQQVPRAPLPHRVLPLARALRDLTA
jgi:hypothetical protein